MSTALWLVSISVAFGVASGAASVITGLQGHSLGVFAIGLGVRRLRQDVEILKRATAFFAAETR